MENLTPAQQELYDWLVEYVAINQQAPSIRQMMKAMNLRSPAPIQSRLERLRNKGYVDWTNGKAHTIKILNLSERQISININIENNEDLTESIALELAILCKSLNAYHIACGGNGLIVDDWKSFASTLQLVEV